MFGRSSMAQSHHWQLQAYQSEQAAKAKNPTLMPYTAHNGCVTYPPVSQFRSSLSLSGVWWQGRKYP